MVRRQDFNGVGGEGQTHIGIRPGSNGI